MPWLWSQATLGVNLCVATEQASSLTSVSISFLIALARIMNVPQRTRVKGLIPSLLLCAGGAVFKRWSLVEGAEVLGLRPRRPVGPCPGGFTIYFIISGEGHRAGLEVRGKLCGISSPPSHGF